MRSDGFHEGALEMLLWYQSEHNSLKLYRRTGPPQRKYSMDIGRAVPRAIPARLVARSKLALNRNPVAPAPRRGTEQRRSVYAD